MISGDQEGLKEVQSEKLLETAISAMTGEFKLGIDGTTATLAAL